MMRLKKGGGRILLLASLLMLSELGCASHPPKVSLSPTTANYTPRDYKPVLKRWTRSLKLNTLAEMDNVLTVTSTYQSSDFRAAYVARYADDYELSAAQRDTLAKEQQAVSQTQHEFYVALYGQHPEYGDLDADTSAWTVELVDAQGTVTRSSELTEIRKPSVHDISYFPYTSPYRKVFRIVFPLQSEGKPSVDPKGEWFGLRFVGPQGKAQLVWELSSGAASTGSTTSGAATSGAASGSASTASGSASLTAASEGATE